MPPKGQGIVNPSRRFVGRSSLSRKSTTDLTENENQDCMKGVDFRSPRLNKTILCQKLIIPLSSNL
jgi:hypothetical protein